MLSVAEMVDVADLRWQEDALCLQVDPDLWFPEKGQMPTAALRVCSACPVLRTCAEWALPQSTLSGVCGGMTEKHRKAERARRLRTARAAQRRDAA